LETAGGEGEKDQIPKISWSNVNSGGEKEPCEKRRKTGPGKIAARFKTESHVSSELARQPEKAVLPLFGQDGRKAIKMIVLDHESPNKEKVGGRRKSTLKKTRDVEGVTKIAKTSIRC